MFAAEKLCGREAAGGLDLETRKRDKEDVCVMNTGVVGMRSRREKLQDPQPGREFLNDSDEPDPLEPRYNVEKWWGIPSPSVLQSFQH